MRAVCLSILAVLCVLACSERANVAPSTLDLTRQHQPLAQLPVVQDQQCAECHPKQVVKFKTHGMADSLSAIDPLRMPAQLTDASITNAFSGMSYNVGATGRWELNAQHLASGGAISVPISHRIGAGVEDMSFVLNSNGRWFFSPLEFFTHSGWFPAPHEWQSNAGLDAVPITAQCLQCHSSTPTPDVHPLNNLQDFEPQPISCATCHGDGAQHMELMRRDEFPADLLILNPEDFEIEQQLDLCARCHLEGDAHIELSNGNLQQVAPGEDLLDKYAVMVASHSKSNELRFVSQVQRLTASECFKQSPSMTCTTCHDPHQPARYQQRSSFDAKCITCHQDQVGDHQSQQDEQSCVACHMPRIQPFDLQKVAISDHFIQAQPLPQKEVGFRLVESPSGDWKTFSYRDDKHYSNEITQAIQAMTLFEQGHYQRAAELFSTFAAPGEIQQIALAQFHFLRARSLFEQNLRQQSTQAYRDALLLDPTHTTSMLNLATLLAEDGQLDEAQNLAERVSSRYLNSEAPFNIMIIVANQRNDLAAMKIAAENSLECNPMQPAIQRVLMQLNERNL